ncbi:uncharacterized protein AMSG_05344 [Thecamonas trahens ATCC 50062]|uniref:Uncharacterized protein n=1 Tax=Thecamonas trahens ATCC 50062 TaxID=461836 RepID=A0A0L0DAF8_THETB|nr:hypothetical protein AMSG_05344 [Thecamonas trahens ATCC 50062]KNC49344.1 hypothetical protein AMSG_05344 [Thecamonas trahens ATCC 50062]|eukprot:XP_013758051.1 hypothetical protein AMSG_05344 [Thecamonas trahens ATCC 50062]
MGEARATARECASSTLLPGKGHDTIIVVIVTRVVQRNVVVPVEEAVTEVQAVPRVEDSVEVRSVPYTRLVEVEEMIEEDEEYIEMEEVTRTVTRIEWVPKEVIETIVESVPVKKTRRVSRPVKRVKEVHETAQVSIPVSRLVVDQIPVTRTVTRLEHRTLDEPQAFRLTAHTAATPSSPYAPARTQAAASVGRLPTSDHRLLVHVSPPHATQATRVPSWSPPIVERLPPTPSPQPRTEPTPPSRPSPSPPPASPVDARRAELFSRFSSPRLAVHPIGPGGSTNNARLYSPPHR